MLLAQPSIAVVVPTRHEATNVVELHRRLSASMDACHTQWELVFVDDSDDETPEVLARLSDAHPEVTVVHRPVYSRLGGLGGAVLAGVAATSADLLLVMDADLQHPPERAPDLLHPLVTGAAELVVGSRYQGGGSAQGLDGPARRAVSLGSRAAAYVVLPRARAVKDPLGGFFAFRREVIDGVALRPDGYKILLEILTRGRWSRVIEVPYAFAARDNGRSKASMLEGRRFLRHVGRLAVARPPIERTAAPAVALAGADPGLRVPRLAGRLVAQRAGGRGPASRAAALRAAHHPVVDIQLPDMQLPDLQLDLSEHAPAYAPTLLLEHDGDPSMALTAADLDLLEGGLDTGPDPAAASLRVLLLTSEAPPVVSGISRTAEMISDGLRARGHVVDVVSRADYPHLVRNEIRVSAFSLFWPRLRRQLPDYDVVNVFGPVPTISEVFLALSVTLHRAHRPAIVYTHHSDLAIPGLARWCRFYNRVSDRLAHNADAVVVTSEAYRRKIARRGGARVEVVPWGVDTTGKVLPRVPGQGGALRLLFVGQFRPYKGLPTLIDAVAGERDLQLTLVGDGPLRTELEAQARGLQADNVSFRGRVSDDELWQAYSEHDVVVLPSTTTAEAFGLVLAEGMAAGCVPVASDLEGVREVAGPTGLLVRPGDTGDLRATLHGLAQDRPRLGLLQSASLHRAKRLTFDHMVSRYETLFQELAGQVSQVQDGFAMPSSWSTPHDYLQAATTMVGASRGSLVLFDRTLGIRSASRAQLSPRLMWDATGSRSRLGETPVSEFVARTRRPLFIGDVVSDPRAAPLLHRSELSSAILLPVRVTRSSVAVLALSTGVDEGPVLTGAHLRTAVSLLLP